MGQLELIRSKQLALNHLGVKPSRGKVLKNQLSNFSRPCLQLYNKFSVGQLSPLRFSHTVCGSFYLFVTDCIHSKISFAYLVKSWM